MQTAHSIIQIILPQLQ